MGWREVLGNAGYDVARHEADPCDLAGVLLAMPAPDRIALALELLAGTGRCVAREVGDIPLVRPRQLGESEAHDRGWNACRAAMLGESEQC